MTMTREELVHALEEMAVHADFGGDLVTADVLSEAAAMLGDDGERLTKVGAPAD